MNLSDWIGRSETASDVITATPYAGLSGTLDRPASRPPVGTPLPALWHWLYFLPLAPPVGDRPRRPSAARRVPAAGAIAEAHVGGQPVRISVAASRGRRDHPDIDDRRVTAKRGRSGSLVFVRVRHEVRREGLPETALVEFHDIVYREAPKPGTSRRRRPPRLSRAAWQRQWIPDDVLLFRYSALTFNGHRIHYDRRYATEVEGYPGLVVHGPLIATLLLDLVRRSCRRRASSASSSGRCGRSATFIRSSCAANRNRTGRRSGCGHGTTRARWRWRRVR